MVMKIGLLGAGNVGLSLGFAMKKKGLSLAGVNDIDPRKMQEASAILECPKLATEDLMDNSEILMFAIPDDSIKKMYSELKSKIPEKTLLAHFSASLSSEVFDSAEFRLSAHPAQVFPYPRLEDDVFKDVSFALEGNPKAVAIFEPLIKRIGGKPFPLCRENKPLYHTSCVMASNLLIGLLKCAEGLGLRAGLEEKQSREIVLRFAFETITTASEQTSFDKALSGPLLRGDIETIKMNLASIKGSDEEIIYKLLSKILIDVAKEKGLPIEKAFEVRKILDS